MNDTFTDPLADFRRVNTAGTEALALAAASQGVSRLVFPSSIKVNGEATIDTPFSVSDVPHPHDPCGISKHEAEIALRTTEAQTGLEMVIVCTPLAFGLGVGGNFISPVRIAERRTPLPLGTVRNRRTTTSVWNLTDHLESASRSASVRGALALAGDPSNPSTADLMREISAAMNENSRLFRFSVTILLAAGKVLRRSGVIDRLAGSLEPKVASLSADWRWSPPLDSSTRIRRTVQWYRGVPEL